MARHLFLTVLAYHLVHAVRYDLRAHGVRSGWRSIRERSRTWVRLTTPIRTADGKAWGQRQAVDPNNEQQARIAASAGVNFRRHRGRVPVLASELQADGGSTVAQDKKM